jgi:uncharacterized membrane protein
MPPFQNPDESSHFLRAAQLADGGLIGTRYSTVGGDGMHHVAQGGFADPAILTAYESFGTLPLHPEIRATRAQWAPSVHWTSKREMQGFQTASYPPLFYAPSAIGVLIGRTVNMTVVQTLMLSRLLTGTTAVVVGAIAIACAGGAAPWIFAILTLPMSLSLIASTSQDALLFACSSFAGALLARALRSPSAQTGMVLTILGLTLGLIAMTRPAYGALAVVPLGLTKIRWRWRITAAVIAGGCTALWSAIAAATALTNVGDFVGANPSAQWAIIYHNPIFAWNIAWETLAKYWSIYLVEFIGQLGWLDTALPAAYHMVALLMLVGAAVATMLGSSRESISAVGRLVIVLGLVLSAAGIFGLLYLTWTVPGHPTVEGVQGRYFTPLALTCVALLPGFGRLEWRRTHKILLLFVAMFPVITLTVTMRAIVLRYYLE